MTKPNPRARRIVMWCLLYKGEFLGSHMRDRLYATKKDATDDASPGFRVVKVEVREVRK